MQRSRVTATPEAAADAARADRLEALFDAHRDRLYALAVRMAVPGDDAVDLVQETFLRAARARAIPAGAGAEPWLVRVLVNLCRDRYRRRAYRGGRRAELRAAGSELMPSDEEALAARDAVRRALAALPPRRRAVIVLRELEERDAAEVGRLLGMTSTTVRWHLSRARAELRAFLEREEVR